MTVATIADQKLAAQGAETDRNLRDASWCIQQSARCDVLERAAVIVEDRGVVCAAWLLAGLKVLSKTSIRPVAMLGA